LQGPALADQIPIDKPATTKGSKKRKVKK